MAYTTINKSTDYFNTKLYTGNGSTQSISSVGFQPDWVWIKYRNITENHETYDAVRGVTKAIFPDSASSEVTQSAGLTSFDSDGFTLGNRTNLNDNSGTFVSWNWLASNTTASNTDGSITSTVSANTTSGFSIVSYTGTGANATVGHGLGAVPKMIIAKRLTDVESWGVYHVSNGASKYMKLDENQIAETATTVWNNTTPTSSVFSLGTSGLCNFSGKDMIAYCFTEKKGFSKFGSYTGNGNADGTFVYTGFKPSFLIVKRTDDIGGFKIFDNKRNTFNSLDKNLSADSTSAEDSGSDRLDFLSNGFKIRTTSGAYGGASGGSYIYMAFAEAPLVGTNNVPCTAR
jgi:hypothetical protein